MGGNKFPFQFSYSSLAFDDAKHVRFSPAAPARSRTLHIHNIYTIYTSGAHKETKDEKQKKNYIRDSLGKKKKSEGKKEACNQ